MGSCSDSSEAANLENSNPGELTSTQGDIIRRAFWHCSIMETSVTSLSSGCTQLTHIYSCFNLELGMPLSGLDRYETLVRVPDFGGPVSQEDHTSHFQEHFASQIVLRRLSADFNNVLSSGKDATHHVFNELSHTRYTSLPFDELTLCSIEFPRVLHIVLVVTCAGDTRRYQATCYATRSMA